MGLFDFVKDFGKKIFSSDDDNTVAAEKIKEVINQDNPGIEDLTVTLNDDNSVSIGGNASSQAALEKAVLIAGNTQGVTNVGADDINVQTSDEEITVEYYTIEKGDTLWAIATKFYGNGAKYTKIVEDNLEVIKDADKIYPGQKIRIVK